VTVKHIHGSELVQKIFGANNFFFAVCKECYRAFLGFGQAKFPHGGSVLGSSQFTVLPQLPLEMMLDSKVVKIDSKIIILLH